MIIALAKSEISSFLECSHIHLKGLWSNNILRRTVYVDGRSNPELSHSSVLDVLEYYLRSEVIPGADPDEIEIWLTAIDEFVEQGTWDGRSFEDMVFDLMQIVADFSGAPRPADLLSCQATQTLSAYFALLTYLEPHADKARRRAR